MAVQSSSDGRDTGREKGKWEDAGTGIHRREHIAAFAIRDTPRGPALPATTAKEPELRVPLFPRQGLRD